MKKAGLLAICLVSVLCVVPSSLGQKTTPYNRLDITLEGPWILYRDIKSFTNSLGVQVPVLIAIAPSMLKIGDATIQHQPPTLMAGDGFQIKPGINCLIFDGVCGEAESTNSLLSLEYPIESILRLKVQQSWTWYQDASTTNAYYLILPWPDSLSNDGTWPIRFAAVSDASSYMELSATYPPVTIGVHLHYYNGPKKLSVGLCTIPFKSDSATTCAVADAANKFIANTGTLRLVMKAPEIKDSDAVCDPHVRAAYREMLLLLDSTPLIPRGASGTSSNINQAVAFIDPARGIHDTGEPDVDDRQATCRDRFDQTLRSSIIGTQPAKATPNEMMDNISNLYQLFGNVAKIPPSVARGKNAEQLRADQARIQSLFKEMDKVYPRISQLTLAAALAQNSVDLIQFENPTEKLTCSPKSTDPFINLLCADEAYVKAFDTQLKDGKDCRAAIALIGN